VGGARLLDAAALGFELDTWSTWTPCGQSSNSGPNEKVGELVWARYNERVLMVQSVCMTLHCGSDGLQARAGAVGP
jgi:hypothetical protein